MAYTVLGPYGIVKHNVQYADIRPPVARRVMLGLRDVQGEDVDDAGLG